MTDELTPFLTAIARTPLLTKAEERRLAQRVERGDLDAKTRMVEANLRLVVHVARRYQRPGHILTLADLIQEGTIGLVRAVEKFDHRLGYRFSTYATIGIRQAIGRAIDTKGRQVRLSLDDPVGDEEDGTVLGDLIKDVDAPAPEAGLVAADVRRALTGLPARERRVIEARYGLGGFAPSTPSETARALHLRP